MSYEQLATSVDALAASNATLTAAATSAQSVSNANVALAQAAAAEAAATLSSKVSVLDLADKTTAAKAAGQVGFSQSLNYPVGTVGARLKTQLSVADHPFNAVSGETSSTAAFQAAYDAAAEGAIILIPGPGPYTVGVLIGTKKVTWEGQYDLNTNTGLLSLPGTVTGRIGSALTVYRNNGGGTDFANQRLSRIANYAGGAAGQVCSNMYAKTSVTNNLADSFEWVGTFVLDNAGTGQNCAIYGQGNRKAVSAITRGGTFAGCFEARDFTLEANPTSGLIGIEVDIFANGGDSVGRRIGIDMVIGKGVAEGDACEVYAGLRFGPTNGISANARYRNCVLMNGDKDYGLYITGTGVENDINIISTGGKIGVRVAGSHSDADFISEGTSAYGARFSGTYSSGIAIRLATGSAIGLESTGAIKLNYTSGAVQLLNTTVVKNSFNTVTGAISVGANQVLGPRATGWAAMTGTPNLGTVYDVASVTLPQLAARVAALQAALTTHGMIGV